MSSPVGLPCPEAKKRCCKGTKTFSDPIFHSKYRVTSPNLSFHAFQGNVVDFCPPQNKYIEFSDELPDLVGDILAPGRGLELDGPFKPQIFRDSMKSTESITYCEEAWQD